MQLFNRSSTNGSNSTRGRSPYGVQFLLTRVRPRSTEDDAGSVIAFTSANSGEGVSHTVRTLAAQLARQTREPTVIVEAERLSGLRRSDLIDLRSRCARTNIDDLWLLRNLPPNGNGQTPSREGGPWSDFAAGDECLQALRATFKHTLIDCPAISASSDAPLLASNVDGVVLIVAADQTKRDQILHARQSIEMADGKLLALVMNKRRHLVPEWLYRML